MSNDVADRDLLIGLRAASCALGDLVKHVRAGTATLAEHYDVAKQLAFAATVVTARTANLPASPPHFLPLKVDGPLAALMAIETPTATYQQVHDGLIEFTARMFAGAATHRDHHAIIRHLVFTVAVIITRADLSMFTSDAQPLLGAGRELL